ncbi:flavodoxin [Parabacteroides sp. TM07-1AC]|jgi:flavodoxin I|uniref:flavodoxin n=1 Tax=Parabacteroides sp. TM07-1AC TaxID=2292363 RepID=UPI000F00B1E2|nr:flavodoxin [Parabacteroides sp. TM07-1AC]RHU30680.1 flavodoxin [Parabacteroides sp. TM07-1AC]
MKKIGLFYGSSTAKTAAVAQKIKDAFHDVQIDIIPVENSGESDFETYDYIIAGSSTWFDGELPTYWDEIMPIVTSADLKGKKVAVFGLGDQVKYPDNFVDAIGYLAEAFAERGAIVIGQTSTEGYRFNQSQAVKKGKFVGLVLDIENQPEKTDERIKHWVDQVKHEFESESLSTDNSFNC